MTRLWGSRTGRVPDGGTVLCSDLQRARSVADRIDGDMNGLDQPVAPTQADLPFGGVKRSGFGRELSRLGMYGFTNRKLVRTFPPVTA
jgi:succinate-semialdehyde dehydrogenase / glutarate-semialdehyde dehydrogenase